MEPQEKKYSLRTGMILNNLCNLQIACKLSLEAEKSALEFKEILSK